MAFKFFPKTSYVLNSPYCPAEVTDILSNNIADFKNAKTAAEQKKMEAKYFEGEINKYNNLKFTVRYNDKVYSSALNKEAKPHPVNNGIITATDGGSIVHITTNPPVVIYLYITAFFLFPVFLFLFSFPIAVSVFFLCFLIMMILLIRSQYMRILKNDKEKMELIFKGDY